MKFHPHILLLIEFGIEDYRDYFKYRWRFKQQ